MRPPIAACLVLLSGHGAGSASSALVAGDIVASETHNGTLKTILTRSRGRGEVFAGKTLCSFFTEARCRQSPP